MKNRNPLREDINVGGMSLRVAEVMADYRVALVSRQASLIGRREVLSGKAKFGIFGDGKEVPQLALARVFHKGDWRSGYYRDQTLMFALGLSTVRQFFAQLYADSDLGREPASGGRQMNSHYATHSLTAEGSWVNQMHQYNTSADISPTGGQMARLVGLGYASKLYRNSPALQAWMQASTFSQQGGEIAFGTIGNASVSEGVFWEALNAAGVLQIPVVISVWDDDYGISVPNKYQITKESISELLTGFASTSKTKGVRIYRTLGHDYSDLMRTYHLATETCRNEHEPCLIHVTQVTQPQGHSTSGSHERYKTKERLKYEEEMDCIRKMRAWIVAEKIARPEELDEIEDESKHFAEEEREGAWSDFQRGLLAERTQLLQVLRNTDATLSEPLLDNLVQELERKPQLLRRDLSVTLTRALARVRQQRIENKRELLAFYDEHSRRSTELFNAHLCSEHRSPLSVSSLSPEFDPAPAQVDGRQIIQMYFDKKLMTDPRIFIIGEDVGKLGGVNLEFDGLQEKHGELRVSDTGIREATILGQGIGAALRGLRPIVDIQYLDYLLYALQTLSDDLATLHYRTVGTQAAPVIIRTKGHRLEGIWHTGSPLGMLLGSIRGVHLCVPRNCVQAAGMYQTLLEGDDPGVVIEVLNGYRLKEAVPNNLGSYKVPLGVCEVLHPGTDITLVTYGANVRIAQHVIKELEADGISIELIDVQTLLPFDRLNTIRTSIQKTNAVLFFDEDVPGGATAYMMQQVLEHQGAYEYLDAPPRTLCGKAHRAAYGSDGDYYSKPSSEDLLLLIHEMMHERNPRGFPRIV